MPTDTPHLAFPIRRNPDGVTYATEDQDTPREHAQCLALLFSTPIGSLPDNPAFGVPDPLFTQTGFDDQALTAAARQWEPRVSEQVIAITISDRTETVDVTVQAARG